MILIPILTGIALYTAEITLITKIEQPNILVRAFSVICIAGIFACSTWASIEIVNL